ncbi:hypothetical protein C1646_748393 [Rhizophagus diaphanus]|nr:hypothetical protein C1646_748393 [Rhizophagus diaphanus] [Rhizophagus sp. MUCL 43196]
MGWNSSHSPKSDKLCDWSKCTLSSEEASGSVLLCSHGYHTECFNQVNQRCPYKYLCNGIKDNCKIFQNMLNMKFDDDKDNGDDLEDQASLEDNDDNVIVFADEDINRKLEEALNSFKLCQ